jgi:hypothetical protein
MKAHGPSKQNKKGLAGALKLLSKKKQCFTPSTDDQSSSCCERRTDVDRSVCRPSRRRSNPSSRRVSRHSCDAYRRVDRSNKRNIVSVHDFGLQYSLENLGEKIATSAFKFAISGTLPSRSKKHIMHGVNFLLLLSFRFSCQYRSCSILSSSYKICIP